MERLGLAGHLANRLIDSPLVPLILVAALLMGAYGLMMTPREDRPDIEVPTALIVIAFPGAGVERVDELVARPVGAWASQLERVVEVKTVAAVSLAVTSIPHRNISAVTARTLERLEQLRPDLVPHDVTVDIAYDAGRAATETVMSVLENFFMATVVVVVIILLGLGWRAALGVSFLIPAILAMVAFRAVQLTLVPFLDREVFVVEIELPPGSPLERTLEAAATVGRALHPEPEVRAYTVFAGQEGPLLMPPPGPPDIVTAGSHRASLYVQLTHKDERTRLSFELGRELFHQLPDLLAPFDGRAWIRHIPSGPSSENAIQAEIFGADHGGRQRLADTLETLETLLERHHAAGAVERFPKPAGTELQLTVDQTRASAQGVLAARAAAAVQMGLSGRTATDLDLPGEWQITQQVYRDLAWAGLAVILVIYTLLSAWFNSYVIPLVIMAPIPLVFIGVIPAHWLMGLDIAGLGVLGVIALAGIVVRNAVLLVDFTQKRLEGGMEICDALVSAGSLRTRPILLTAGTVAFGSGALIFEPALQPLGLTLISGVVVATLLTLILIPVLYYSAIGTKRG